ncbi:hypothetical protein JCM9279_003859 [Rhodotorula babjevae]
MSSPSVDNASAGTAATTTSLLDLPGELVSRVFKSVYELERDDKRIGVAVTFERIRISRRIYSIAYPLWLERLRAPNSGGSFDSFLGGMDEFLGAMVAASTHWQHIRTLDIPDSGEVPALVASLIRALPALEHVALVVPRAPPYQVIDALVAQRSLRRLTLRGRNNMPAGFILSETSVRHLSTEIGGELFNDDKGVLLDEIELPVISIVPFAANIPWRSLSSLRLPGSGGCALRDGMRARPALDVAADAGPLPLETFELAIDHEDADPLDVRGHQRRYDFLFAVLARAKPSRVRISRMQMRPPRMPAAAEAFPSVRTLAIEGLLDLTSAASLGFFAALLARFPSLTSLILQDFAFHSAHSKRLPSHFLDLPRALFGIRYPTFAALHALVRSTRVLTFEFHPALPLFPAPEYRFLRCTRSSSEDDFTAETFGLH